MKRRKALWLTASILGGTVIGSDIFLVGCVPKENNKALFSISDINLLDEVGETILPETDLSPGAKAAKIGLFMKTIVSDCYSIKEQQIFIKGIHALNLLAQDNYNQEFTELAPAQKNNLLVQLDKKTKEIADGEPVHFFSMMKQLTIWGFFTSEPGATKALRYNPTPGTFKGCIPYENGDKAWA